MNDMPFDVVPDDTEDLRTRDLASKRKRWLTRLAIGVLLVALLVTAYYFLFGRNHISTENAYVNAEIAQVTPLFTSTVLDVRAKDTQAVKKGDILVRLDPADAQIAMAKAEAALADARRRYRQSVATSGALSAQVQSRGADIASAQATLASAEADARKAQVDLSRRQALAKSGAVSGEELSNAREALSSAQAAVSAARAGVIQARSNRSAAQGELAANDALVRGSSEENDPGVLAAKAQLASARLDMAHTVIRAPIDGVVSQRKVQIGQRVETGKPIMSIVPVDAVYVDANFKEGQLRRVRLGMPVEVTADIYGSDVVYHGKVVGLSGGTGASMSLIPAQNATGNWIKVVQRLPVRIELDKKELAAHPLRVGLSTEVEIDLTAD